MRLEDLPRFDAEVEVTKATVLKASDDYGTVESAVRDPQDDSSKWCVTRNVDENNVRYSPRVASSSGSRFITREGLGGHVFLSSLFSYRIP